MKRFITLTVCIGLQASMLLTTANAQSVAISGQGLVTSSAIVQLRGDPVSIAASTKPPQGKKIDFTSASVNSQQPILSAIRNDFKSWLHDNAPAANVTREFDIALNAGSVALHRARLEPT